MPSPEIPSEKSTPQEDPTSESSESQEEPGTIEVEHVSIDGKQIEITDPTN